MRGDVSAALPVIELPAEPGVELGPATMPLASAQRESGSLILATLTTPAGTDNLVLLADEDARQVRVLSPDTHAELSHLELDAAPTQLIVADGRVYATLRDRNEVVALEVTRAHDAALTEIARWATEVEPVALAATATRLFVVSAWGRRLQSYQLPGHAPLQSIGLEREPRGVTVSEDGAWAYVAHAVGSRITRVALTETWEREPVQLSGRDYVARRMRPRIHHLPHDMLMFLWTEPVATGAHGEHLRHAVQGFAIAEVDGHVVAPEVLVHHGEAVSSGYGSSEGFAQNQPALAMIPMGAEEATLRVAHYGWAAKASRQNSHGGLPRAGCFLPRAVATDGDKLLVACLGSDDVLAYDASAQAVERPLVSSLRGRWKVPAGPMGIAVDSAKRRAFVWSQYDRKLSTLTLPEGDYPQKIHEASLPTHVSNVAALPSGEETGGLSAAALRGRRLFHAATDTRLSADGRACASCHPDGREDGLSWPTPKGSRQTPMLSGRLASTEPYGWSGDEPEIAGHLKHTFANLAGRGLDGSDLDDLLAYLGEAPTPTRRHSEPAERVARGRELFFSETVGCAVCHTDGDGSDGQKHQLGRGPKLDTPSLRFIAGTGPYFHDGRYDTLEQLLRESQGEMGWATNMKDDDIAALAAYLRTL